MAVSVDVVEAAVCAIAGLLAVCCLLLGLLQARIELVDAIRHERDELWAECDELRLRLDYYERLTSVTAVTRHAIARLTR
jgi:hypothetical protein